MTDLVIGMGEIGNPIASFLADHKRVLTRDVENLEVSEEIEAVHICYNFDAARFVETVVEYIRQYNPDFCFIHSTVIPGTSRKVQQKAPFVDVVHSPVRGRHGDFGEDMLKYSKWLAANDELAELRAVNHLQDVWKIRTMRKFETLELAKLFETSYTAVLVAWAQEMNRYADRVGADLDEAILFTDELEYLPAYQFAPSYIGGHCVIPNVEILQSIAPSNFLRAVLVSNEVRQLEMAEAGMDIPRRVYPRRIRK